MVMDNGSPQLSSTTRIVINVGDFNDHPPKFDLHVYNVQIPSNAQIDQKVFQVSVHFSVHVVMTGEIEEEKKTIILIT